MPWRFGLAIAGLLIIAATASAAFAADRPACDLDALRRYPVTDALKNRAVPLGMPDIFFAAPDEAFDFRSDYQLDEKGAAKLRAALARGLATFPPAGRSVLMLAAIAGWTGFPDGLLGFFVSRNSVLLNEALQTLDAAGYEFHATLLREGSATFGPDYGTQRERYDRWSDGHGHIRDHSLDFALRRLSTRFRALPSLLDAAAEEIARSRELTAIYEPLRAEAPDDRKLAFLAGGLWKCLNHYDEPDKVAARLASLPAPYGRIIVVFIFNAEMLNGAVEQFFFNSSGGLAPDVADALDAMGLNKHADAVRRGVAMFPKPYPRALKERRDFMLGQGRAFSDALNKLTDAVDDGAIPGAMVKTARDAGVLPN
ncbi:DMP19 family protein [Terrarubrum flagellatum]|uniref:DMP19 family protein n=1 Tax=Terrirubrum flagellatum TaxID=2895980 RepID=UPI0031455998